MKVICVDDEELILRHTLKLLEDIKGVEDAKGFNGAEAALDYLRDNSADVAILDIDMPGMNGITLAERIKKKDPDTAIIFLTGYSEYAVEAFSIRASGYLLKPVSKKKLEDELSYVKQPRPEMSTEKKVVIKTFGEFDVFADGKPVAFSRSKAKELLAWLVDRQGGTVSRAEAFAMLWEDLEYDRSMQKQFDVVIRSLRQTLTEYGIADILDVQRGGMRVVPENLDSDLYRFLAGDITAVNAYRGEYMSSYTWASDTEGFMSTRLM